VGDIYTKEKRSEIMSKISGKETRPEILVRKYLFSNSFRFRKNDNRYPGKPDIVLPKYKTAIFVHGCFWHGHDCKAGKLPETRKDFWQKKINDTKSRDRAKNELLKTNGWKVITIWDCELKTRKKRDKRLKALSNELKSNKIEFSKGNDS
jgi:DNA mismatch endonuclease (patch repair protein)